MNEGSAPRPKNFDEMVAAFQLGDPIMIAKELAKYDQQCREAGYSDYWLETGKLDPRTPAY